MPIFEYVCQKCGFQFERLLRSAGAEQSCPRCAGVARRQVSAAAAPPAAPGCAPRGGFS
jgi:putative FmdB family regulatory protein